MHDTESNGLKVQRMVRVILSSETVGLTEGGCVGLFPDGVQGCEMGKKGCGKSRRGVAMPKMGVARAVGL